MIECQDLLLLANSIETAHFDEENIWLSYEDFISLVAYRLYDESSEEELLKAFNAFDVTGDGVLQASEMREVVFVHITKRNGFVVLVIIFSFQSTGADVAPRSGGPSYFKT